MTDPTTDRHREAQEPTWIRLAAIIREVDGNHDLGAAALAVAILAHKDFAALSPAGPEEPREGLTAAVKRGHNFDRLRPVLESLPRHASMFEMAGACAADVSADVMKDRCAYDRRILLVTLESALEALAATSAPDTGAEERLRAARLVAWLAMVEDIMGLWGVADPDMDDVLETLAEHRPLILANTPTGGSVDEERDSDES